MCGGSNVVKRICVYCASSRSCDQEYHEAARRLGEVLARAGYTVIFGGGAVGSMGALADGALGVGGEVIGVIPHFMVDLEWAHDSLTRLDRVEDMRLRKHKMLEDTCAVIALPGGSGTLEELFEVLTLKRLGVYRNPVLLINTRGYFDKLVKFLAHCIDERFMNPRHTDMWSVVPGPDQVLAALAEAPHWPENAVDFAAVSEEESQPVEAERDCPKKPSNK